MANDAACVINCASGRNLLKQQVYCFTSFGQPKKMFFFFHHRSSVCTCKQRYVEDHFALCFATIKDSKNNWSVRTDPSLIVNHV